MISGISRNCGVPVFALITTADKRRSEKIKKGYKKVEKRLLTKQKTDDNI